MTGGLSAAELAKVIEAAINGGYFVFGAFCGGYLNSHWYNQANKERLERAKFDAQERKELLRQLENKDRRIDALHLSLKKQNKKKLGDDILL